MVRIFRKRFDFSKIIPNRNISSLISVVVNDSSGIATVSLQKPPVNTLNSEILEELSATITNLEKEKARGFILTSSRDGVFSGGLDLFEIYKQHDKERMKRYWNVVRQTWMKLSTTSYPTAAVINGHAPAGGCLFSIACEYRVMTKNYRIGGNETVVGLVAPVWFMERMRDLIGFRQTEMAFTTGQLFTTEEALSLGLVDDMVNNKEEGISKAEAFIKKFDKIPSRARSLTKKLAKKEMLGKMIREEELDTKHFVHYNSKQETQEIIGNYLKGIKSRSKA
nr:enoyl-CoA delta isomerase 1, mitochondrial-like [Leptinotarsa decemlineata]